MAGLLVGMRSTLPSKDFKRSKISTRVLSFLVGTGSRYLSRVSNCHARNVSGSQDNVQKKLKRELVQDILHTGIPTSYGNIESTRVVERQQIRTEDILLVE